MFFLSQVVLNKFKLCDHSNLSSYSIATGIALYGALYIYFLYYNEELLSVFNKFMIYVISVDLLLSTFYFYQINTKGIRDNLNNLDESASENDKNEEYDEEYEHDDDDNELESQLTEGDTDTNTETETEQSNEEELQEIHELHNDRDENINQTTDTDDKLTDKTENTEQLILNEAEQIIRAQDEKESENIFLLENQVQIKPRRRRKASTPVLQI